MVDNDNMLTGNMTPWSHTIDNQKHGILSSMVLFGSQLYTHPLIIPDVHQSDPNATFQDKPSSTHARVDVEIAHGKAFKHQQLNQSLCDIPQMFKDVNIHRLKELIDKTIPIDAIKAKIRKASGAPAPWTSLQQVSL